MLSSLQFAHVLAHARATNAGMALGAHVVAKRHHHLLDLLRQLTGRSKDQRLAVLDAGLHLLENGNAEGGSFSSYSYFPSCFGVPLTMNSIRNFTNFRDCSVSCLDRGFSSGFLTCPGLSGSK